MTVDTREVLDVITDRLTDAMTARSMNLESVPMRRHDEKGWFIGHVVGGVLFTDQISCWILNAEGPETDDEINRLLDKLQHIQATTSAMPSRLPHASYVTANGLIVRFCPYNGGLRGDVVVNRMAQNA